MPGKNLQALMECGPKCRSKRHAYDLNAAVSKGTLTEIKAYIKLCHNGGQVSDQFRRSLLHMAAACGKVDVVEWLVEEMRGDITQKDAESGWTALHRAVFYGQLSAARLLIQYKSDITTRDHEGLGPLEIAMKDRELLKGVSSPVFTVSDGHEIFTWGDNSNFTLGHSTEQRRLTPEVVDVFRKMQKCLKQILMCKYHTVFVTRAGEVFTCGHGLGGRLGHQTEETCLVPRLVEALKSEECAQVAGSHDHTLFLTASGAVYSCGSNQSHQLGLVPIQENCLVPRMISNKTWKGREILGIAAGRFHSVVFTSNAVYTCGLNAGQLGHPKSKGDRKISHFKQVSALNVKDLCVVSLVCSDAATVILTKKGEIYVLHEYQCRKIASNRSDVQKLCMVGGNLDHTDSQILRENGGCPLIISYLSSSGKVFIWHEKSPSLKRASWLIRRSLFVTDFALSENGVAMVTEEGEVFLSTLGKPSPVRDSSQSGNKESIEGAFGQMTLMELLMREETEELQVRLVPHIHRASYIAADKKGHNFAVIQSLPYTCLTDVPSVCGSVMRDCFEKLLEEADEFDLVHDLILQIKEQRWPVHRFIMISRCANFPSLLANIMISCDLEKPVLDLCDIQPQILEQLLRYIYTDTCDLVSPGAKFVLDRKSNDSSGELIDMDMEFGADVERIEGRRSAFEVISKQRQKKGKKKAQEQKGYDQNPLKMLADLARQWGVKGLAKRISSVSWKNGKVESTGKADLRTSLSFDRNKLRGTKWEMYDVSVVSDDGEVFQCHKCILVARLQYFHSMLGSGWIETTCPRFETSSNRPLPLAVPADVLDVLIEYLYTDDAKIIAECTDAEKLCNILVVADQMLSVRLKQMCEVAIAALVSMKNVGELLEFSSTYNASQLKATCQQFISLNLASLLEGRYLDVLSDEVIADLTQYYRQAIPNMSRRMITPFDEGPDRDFLEKLGNELGVDYESTPLGAPSEPKKSKSRKRRNRTKSSAEDGEKHGDRGPRNLSESGRGVVDAMPERQLEAEVMSQDTSLIEQINVVEPLKEGTKIVKVNRTSPSGRREDGQACGDTITNNSSSSNSKSSHTAYTKSSGNSKNLGISKDNNKTNDFKINNNSNSSSSSNNNSSSYSVEGGISTSRSLRDIILEEEARSNKKLSKQSTNSEMKAKFSWRDVKKQQQNKQKCQGQEEVIHEGQRSSNEGGQPLQKFCPWGSSTQEVRSFRSAIEQDKATSGSQHKDALAISIKTPKPAVKGSPVSSSPASLSWGLQRSNRNQVTTGSPTLKINPTKGVTSPQAWSSAGPTSPESPEKPWSGEIIQSPTSPICSFYDIVKDEQLKVDTLTRASNKPLALIQIEEQAIQDLLIHYKAADSVEERIIVERVVTTAATPLWKRERLQSS